MNVLDVIRRLDARAKAGVLSQIPFPAHALRETIARHQPSFLAEPVIESAYPWEPGDASLDDLVTEGVLKRETVEALTYQGPFETLPAGETGSLQPRNISRPYKHQLAAWRALDRSLKSPTRTPLLVASGTGSGKTECFLVPLLNDLIHAGRGVQAIMLYPLNALIASQRERLLVWTAKLNRRHFCLYNGNTPHHLRADVRQRTPQEERTRDGMRSDPVPILVTNPSMLEYILIRGAEAGLRSQGMLRWIILDEAHSLLGSQAADMAMLLRRVMQGFDVEPEQVQVVATSATLGEDAEADLKRFVCDLSGRAAGTEATYVTAKRLKPDWPAPRRTSLSLAEARTMTGTADAAALQDLKPLHRLREQLLERPGALRLSQATELLLGTAETVQTAEMRQVALDLIDHAAQTRDASGQALLPYRIHLFHRTQSALRACIDPACTARPETLPEAVWPYGAIGLKDEEVCACGGLMLPLRVCTQCNLPALEGELADQPRESPFMQLLTAPERRSIHSVLELDQDSAAAEGTDSDDDAPAAAPAAPMEQALSRWVAEGLLTGARLQPVTALDGRWGLARRQQPGARTVGLREITGHSCPACAAGTEDRPAIFRKIQGTGEFLLNALVPTVLDAVKPPVFPQDPNRPRPLGGRRLLSFTDSRQGTAGLSLRLKRDAERVFVRSFVFHYLQAIKRDRQAQAGAGAAQHAAEILQLEKEIPILQDVPGLEALVLQHQQRLDALRSESHKPDPVTVPIADVITQLSQRDEIGWIRQSWIGMESAEDMAKLLLLREINRRPRRGNTLETLGLVAIEAPVSPIVHPPQGFDKPGWRQFLQMLQTFVLRAQLAYSLPPGGDFFRHIVTGADRRQRPGQVYRRDAEPGGTNWPSAATAPQQRGRALRLLRHVLRLDYTQPQDRDRAEEILDKAWTALQPACAEGVPYLQLRYETLQLRLPEQIQACPVTGTAFAGSFGNVSPFLPASMDGLPTPLDEPLPLPTHPAPWARSPGDRAAIEDWLQTDPQIKDLRDRGLWKDLMDRIALPPALIRHEEHTAQVERPILERYEQAFRDGMVNVLNCSTTMEMGIDIADVTAVLMTTVPPHAANYRQRVGRAGRRNDPTALGLTLCRAGSALGRTVFDNPLWPFQQRILPPKVVLDSPRLVQRHLNAWVFGLQCPADPAFLRAGELFLSDFHQRFAETCTAWAAEPEKRAALAALVAGTALEGQGDACLETTVEKFLQIREAWILEHDRLRADLTGLDGAARLAVENRILSQKKVYGLSLLAKQGFLPGYGFPVDVVGLDLRTLEKKLQIQHENQANAQPGNAERQRRSRLDGPEREMSIALLEYSPGNSVVINGRVHEVQGVRPFWRATDEPDPWTLKTYWSCSNGHHGVSFASHASCPSCQRGSVKGFKILEPKAFKLDWFEKSRADLDQSPQPIRIGLPVPSMGDTPWQPLAKPGLGRIRSDLLARVLETQSGLHDRGYALCLKCGRMESESAERDASLPAAIVEHRSLRDGRPCDVPVSTLQRHVHLGREMPTEMVELELMQEALLPDLQPNQDPEPVGWSLLVAIREALARQIGVQASDMGLSCKPGHAEGKPSLQLYLWDRASGGAGFATRLVDDLHNVLALAETQILECPDRCTSACPACLLSRGVGYIPHELDRRPALEAIRRLRGALDLEEPLKVFGAETRLCLRDLQVELRRCLSRGQAELTGVLSDPAQIEDWPLLPLFKERAGRRRQILVPKSAFDALTDAEKFALYRQALHLDADLAFLRPDPLGRHPAVAVAAVIRKGNPATLFARAGGSTGPLVSAEAAVLPAALRPGKAIEEAAMLPPAEAGTRLIQISQELDGPLVGFGLRFWTLLINERPELGKWLTRKGRVQVTYTDRYLRSPLMIALLAEVLRAEMLSVNAVTIRTTNVLGTSMQHGSWNNDFLNNAEREKFTKWLLLPGIHPVFDCGPQHHARDMVLSRDRETWTLLLDQGFGHWGPRNTPRFDFANVTGNGRVREALYVQGKAQKMPLVLHKGVL